MWHLLQQQVAVDPASAWGQILMLAAALGGAIKWAASSIVRAINRLISTVEREAKARESNTLAVIENTAARKASAPIVKLFFLCALLLPLAGSANDPFIARAFQRDRTIWSEDRRPVATPEEWTKAMRDAQAGDVAAQHFIDTHLDPELAKSREAEFDAHDRYANSK